MSIEKKICSARFYFLYAFLILTVFGSSNVFSQVNQYDRLDHRDDFEMESISGGDFRDYVSTHIIEDDAWAYSMQTLGNFHNHMHEMMSEIARYAQEDLGDEYAPQFDLRISGGEWTTFRKNLEKNNPHSGWLGLVQTTEIMHDRVHHAMSKALIYDTEIRDRDVKPEEYLRTDPLSPEIGIPPQESLRYKSVSQDEFREFAWNAELESDHLHASIQKMAIFNHLLYDLLNQWADISSTHENVECRPESDRYRVNSESWTRFSNQVNRCDDSTLKELVQISELMKNRIHHMMYKMVELHQQ